MEEDTLIQDETIRKRTISTVDKCLLESGPFGRYQLMLLFLSVMIFTNGFSFQSLITYYVADDPPWVCASYNVSSFCIHEPFQEGSPMFAKRCHLNRDQWKYTIQKTYSITTEFDLICSNDYLKALSTALFFIGCLFGALLSGPIADKFGRKPVITGAFMLDLLASVSGYFVNHVWQYLLVRTIIGLAFGTLAPTIFIYFSENMSPKVRGWACNLYFLGFTFSMLWLSLVAYFVPYWRKLVLYTSAFPLLALVLSCFILESPYWLSSNKKFDKAEEVLQKIAKINKKEVSISLNRGNGDDVEKKVYSYFHLFNSMQVFMLTIFQCYLWLGVGLVYYSIALESSNLGGNLYANFILSSLADVPAICIAMFTSVYVGRKKVVGVNFLLCGVITLVIGLLPEVYTTVRVSLAIIGRMFAAIIFNTVFLWTFEIYPTVIRSKGMNICQTVSRIGSAGAPFLTSVLQDIDPKISFFIMSAVSVVGFFCVMFLPEMLEMPTREDYEDLLNNHVVPADLSAHESDINN